MTASASITRRPGRGDADRVRPRIRRRLPQLRGAAAVFRAALPRASRSTPAAIRPPTCRRIRRRYSQDRARDDIRDVLDGARDREGPYRRHLDGRLCDLAFRLRLSRTRPLARRRRLRLRRASPASASNSTRRSRSTAALIESRGMAEVAKTYGAGPDPRAVPEQGPARLGRVRWRSSPSTRRRARRNTMRGVQARRPSLWELTDAMKQPRRSDPDHDRRRGRPVPRTRAS